MKIYNNYGELVTTDSEVADMSDTLNDILDKVEGNQKLLQRQLLLLSKLEKHGQELTEQDFDTSEVQEELADDFSSIIEDEVE